MVNATWGAQASVQTALGQLRVAASDRGLVCIEVCTSLEPAQASPADAQASAARICAAALEQIDEYLGGQRKVFDLPLDLAVATGFQRLVWSAAQRIPYGELCTYGDLATRIGKPGGARAVGGALGANPVLLLIPCHRVVRAGGELGGFTAGLALKRRLLELEGHTLNDDDVVDLGSAGRRRR